MIRQSALMDYAARSTVQKSDRALQDAQRLGRQTAFLSHSHRDRILAKGVQAFLQSQGWDVYIDWEDAEMPAKPNRRNRPGWPLCRGWCAEDSVHYRIMDTIGVACDEATEAAGLV